MNNVSVKVHKYCVGTIVYESGEYIFDYNTKTSDHFVSLTMPVRAKDYVHNNLHPIFEMHLPEGYLLSIIKKHFSKIAKTDDFGLLKIMSQSIRGRVNYKNSNNKHTDDLCLDDLLHSNDDNLFGYLVDRFALTSALSGVQPKVMARIINKATLKLDDYIVKSWGDDYPELAINEYYCMKIVKNAGVPTPDFYISDDEKLFIMKRFDISDNGNILGFEDMCVLMAKQRDDKYDSTCEQIVKSIKIFVSNRHKSDSLINFFKMTVINHLVQNGDAHLKNFGLVYSDINDIKLAPAYDVVSTTVYIAKDIPALHLLGSKKWLNKKQLLQFGMKFCELSNADAIKSYGECQQSVSIILLEIKSRLRCETNKGKRTLLQSLVNVFELAVL